MIPERLALKRATADMVKGAGGVEAAAAFTRVGKTLLADYGSPNRPAFVPIDVVADLEPLTRDREGWPHVTQALCKAMGGTFVAEPEVPVTGADLFGKLAQLSSEFADVTRAVCDGMSDGKWDRRDASELESQLDDVIRVAIRMRALARHSKGENA